MTKEVFGRGYCENSKCLSLWEKVPAVTEGDQSLCMDLVKVRQRLLFAEAMLLYIDSMGELEQFLA